MDTNYLITPFNNYKNRDKYEKIMKFDFKLSTFEQKSLHMIFFILEKMNEIPDKQQQQQQQQQVQEQIDPDFLKNYLSEFVDEDKKQSVLWWQKQDLEFIEENVYYLNKEKISHLISQNELLIKTAKDLLEFYKQKYDLDEYQRSLDDLGLRKIISFIQRNSIFVRSLKFIEKEKDFQVIVPLFFEFFGLGPQEKGSNVGQRCSIEESVENYVFFGEDYIKGFTDCDFYKGEQIFAVDRNPSSIDSFLRRGQVNLNQDAEEIEVQIDLSKKEVRVIENLEILGFLKKTLSPLKRIFFTFDNFSVNQKFLQYLAALKYIQDTTEEELKIDEFIQKASEKYIQIAVKDYLSFIEKIREKLPLRSISQDFEELFLIKNSNQFNKHELSIKINTFSMRFLQRRTLEAQTHLITRNLLEQNIIAGHKELDF